MALFDSADANKTTENRRESTVALQALYMMNSPFLKETANAFAQRIVNSSSDVDARIRLAWEITQSRVPVDEELLDARSYISDYQAELKAAGHPDAEADQMAWSSFARALLSSNEFLYVD